MHFIFFILLIALFIFLFILMSVLGFIRTLFGFGRRKNRTQDINQTFDQQVDHKEKIFKKNEGEYVDYQEVEEVEDKE